MKVLSLLVSATALLATVATLAGIFSSQGPGTFEYASIRGQSILIYGKGVYRHMSAEVAPQGIAQDVVTLLLGIPLLLCALYHTRKGRRKGLLLLAGTLGYFLVTYLFYMLMAMYNELFLLYVTLCSTSFFAFFQAVFLLNKVDTASTFHARMPVQFIGGFMLFNALAIGLLWLMVVVPPLLQSGFPVDIAHYTTLVVQGLDLALLLPSCFILGLFLLKRKPLGYLLAPVYIIFLAILMVALTAKVIGMALLGAEVFPASILIPSFTLLAFACALLVIRHTKEVESFSRNRKEDSGESKSHQSFSPDPGSPPAISVE